MSYIYPVGLDQHQRRFESDEHTVPASPNTYVESPQDPSAGSYSPPGMGFRRLSKVVGFSIFLTEIALISAGVRKSKSTVSMAEEMGCEIFMMPDQQSSS